MTTADELRHKTQTYFNDVEVGFEFPSLVIGPITATHVFRWSAAIENWHRIHYDRSFAIYHEGLPNVLVQGSWKQNILPRYLKDLCLPNGWAWKVKFQHRAMIVPGETISTWASVTKKREVDGMGFLDLKVGMRLDDETETCPGDATIVLPIRGGREIPYPFVAPRELTEEAR